MREFYIDYKKFDQIVSGKRNHILTSIMGYDTIEIGENIIISNNKTEQSILAEVTCVDEFDQYTLYKYLSIGFKTYS